MLGELQGSIGGGIAEMGLCRSSKLKDARTRRDSATRASGHETIEWLGSWLFWDVTSAHTTGKATCYGGKLWLVWGLPRGFVIGDSSNSPS